jgi:hypothetical protein
MRHGLWLISALALSVRTACASSGDQVSGALQVTIKPGEKLRCASPSPRLPDGVASVMPTIHPIAHLS